jgi:hypothetical protein
VHEVFGVSLEWEVELVGDFSLSGKTSETGNRNNEK